MVLREIGILNNRKADGNGMPGVCRLLHYGSAQRMDGSAAESAGRVKKKDSEGESKGIYELLGFGLGVIGLSYDDFCRLTPEEFREICKSWNESREAVERQEWERMRLLAVLTMQPHCKKKLIPERILPFAWDGRRHQKTEAPKLSRAERKARFERLMESLVQDSPSQSQ